MSGELKNKFIQHIIRSEVVSAGAKNIEEVIDAVSLRLRVTDAGEVYSVDWSGEKSDVSLKELIQHVASYRPDLFDQKPSVTVEDNPFQPGKTFNLSRAMALYKSDPETARRLEAEAQRKI